MTTHDNDAARLRELGFEPEFQRKMSFFANFSLGFAYLSPVVGVYTVLGVALVLGGPPSIWSLVIVGCFQLLVALVFGEIVSQYPIAGGVYPWARRLWGPKWGWMTAWMYLWALIATLAAQVYGAGPYASQMLGFSVSTENTIIVALVMIVVATLLNISGTKILATAAMIGFITEMIGAVVVGIWLLTTERHHGLGVLFDSFGTGSDHGAGYLGAFLAAALLGIYQYYGFEACGDVAEEIPNPSRQIPKAMRMTIYVGGAASVFICLSLILAVRDYEAVIAGTDADPIGTVLTEAFGPVGVKFVLAVILVSFCAAALSLQAATSRLLYSLARDRSIAGADWLRKLSKHHVPTRAVVVVAIFPALLVIGSLISTDALIKIVSFAAVGIYIGFHMVTGAALRARMKGWRPSGPFTMGKWGTVVNAVALSYGVLAVINMCWPRTPEAPWYDNYIVLLLTAAVVAAGLIYLYTAHPERNAPEVERAHQTEPEANSAAEPLESLTKEPS